MNLFNSFDLLPKQAVTVKASAVAQALTVDFINVKDNANIALVLSKLTNNKAVFFRGKGAWYNVNLLQHILKLTGKADIYFSTWSISVEAIRKLVEGKKIGSISNFYAVLDRGIRNRKPEIYQQIIANFKNYCFCKCHAKVMVIKNQNFAITVMGSANLTANPRIETGIIILNTAIADENINWILEEVGNARR